MFEPLLEVLGTDENIAAVVAHEIGHICGRHAVKRLQGSLGLNALMILAAAASRDGRTVQDTNEAIAQLMMSYSREDEFETDRLSVKYMQKAGMDPNAVLKSMKVLKNMRGKGKERKYTYYRSHPYLSQRIAAARTEIKGYTDFDSYINMPQETRY
jgi:predicted Zn-dependent protease